eukprot:UC1_evm1s1851
MSSIEQNGVTPCSDLVSNPNPNHNYHEQQHECQQQREQNDVPIIETGPFAGTTSPPPLMRRRSLDRQTAAAAAAAVAVAAGGGGGRGGGEGGSTTAMIATTIDGDNDGGGSSGGSGRSGFNIVRPPTPPISEGEPDGWGNSRASFPSSSSSSSSPPPPPAAAPSLSLSSSSITSNGGGISAAVTSVGSAHTVNTTPTTAATTTAAATATAATTNNNYSAADVRRLAATTTKPVTISVSSDNNCSSSTSSFSSAGFSSPTHDISRLNRSQSSSSKSSMLRTSPQHYDHHNNRPATDAAAAAANAGDAAAAAAAAKTRTVVGNEINIESGIKNHSDVDSTSTYGGGLATANLFPSTTSTTLCKDGDISLVVGGRRFIVQASIFHKYPDTMLGRMFGSGLARCNENGDYLIEQPVSAAAFSAILDYYRRGGTMQCPPNVSAEELSAACSYFLIPFTATSIKCNNVGLLLHELSNRGATNQFVLFLEQVLMPAMARCAQLGQRECHVVVLASEDTVWWDEDMPPALGEQYAQVVHHTPLYRFLFFYENRNIAKNVMKERGLKKIRLGIEGFPTFAERIRRGPGGEKQSVEYHYEQRPFLKASWENEERKSRHVDFQVVRASNPSRDG